MLKVVWFKNLDYISYQINKKICNVVCLISYYIVFYNIYEMLKKWYMIKSGI